MRHMLHLWRRWTLAQQFMLTSLVVIVTSSVAVGWWIGREIEAGVAHRTAETTALYVESFVAPNLVGPLDIGPLPPDRIGALSHLLAETPLGRDIVSFKLWDLDGRVLFSTETDMIGETYSISPGLAAASQGQVVSHISDLEQEENETERGRFPRLLETYSPIRLEPDGDVVAVAEFYQTVDSFETDLAEAQHRTWMVVALGALISYLALSGIVKRGSDTIERQQRALLRTVEDLSTLLDQNNELHGRVRRAATRVTTLNERSLRRIGAELHDGPAQDISLALLRLGTLGRVLTTAGRAGGPDAALPEPPGADPTGDLATIEGCLGRSLQEIRHIASGLRLPELSGLTLAETVAQVIHVHERRTGSSVEVRLGDLPETVPLPTKITVYRVIQEALANAFRHAGGVQQKVTVESGPGGLFVMISDAGPGLVAPHDADEHLGLAVMRERVESLGGRFRLDSVPGGGTTVAVVLPLDGAPDEEDRR